MLLSALPGAEPEPAPRAVHSAELRLHDGQRVIVDGGAGVVAVDR